MEERTLKSWEEFEQALVEINDRRESFYKEHGYKLYSHFRGVSDSEYHLESTLDRVKRGMKFSDYKTKLKIVCKDIATCIGKKWDLETEEPKVFPKCLDVPRETYEFMTYLRHNGFPSPLIDWTRSPYVAAYFAFRKICPETKYVSIFCGLWNLQSGDNPYIYTLGSTITTSPTHFLQQSEYTICFRKEEDEIYFANHEEVKEDVEDQGVLIRYDIPISERQKVLKKLDSMNITAYSLFGSEPSLMETLALREVVFNVEN